MNIFITAIAQLRHIFFTYFIYAMLYAIFDFMYKPKNNSSYIIMIESFYFIRHISFISVAFDVIETHSQIQISITQSRVVQVMHMIS